MKPKKIYIAHSPNLSEYIAEWAASNGPGIGKLFFPERDTEDELEACRRNREVIKECDEVMVFWDEHSHSTIIDVGMAIALDKPITAKFRPEHSLRKLLDQLDLEYTESHSRQNS